MKLFQLFSLWNWTVGIFSDFLFKKIFSVSNLSMSRWSSLSQMEKSAGIREPEVWIRELEVWNRLNKVNSIMSSVTINAISERHSWQHWLWFFFISYTIGCDFSNKCQVIIDVLCFSLDPFLWYYDHISTWYSSTSFTQSFSISVVIGLSLSNI